MTSDLDIYRAAKELIKQHGDKAPIHAAMRADEMLEAGAMGGYSSFEDLSLSRAWKFAYKACVFCVAVTHGRVAWSISLPNAEHSG